MLSVFVLQVRQEGPGVRLAPQHGQFPLHTLAQVRSAELSFLCCGPGLSLGYTVLQSRPGRGLGIARGSWENDGRRPRLTGEPRTKRLTIPIQRDEQQERCPVPGPCHLSDWSSNNLSAKPLHFPSSAPPPLAQYLSWKPGEGSDPSHLCGGGPEEEREAAGGGGGLLKALSLPKPWEPELGQRHY